MPKPTTTTVPQQGGGYADPAPLAAQEYPHRRGLGADRAGRQEVGADAGPGAAVVAGGRVMTTATKHPILALAVACPDCKAAIGQPCTTGSGVVRTFPHVVREKASDKVAKRQQQEAARHG